MTEDSRVGRNPGEPPKSGGAGPERCASYLEWCRQEIIDGVLGLSADEQRRTLVPSGWTSIELMSHVLHMEQRWFVWGFLGEQVAEPWGDWDVDEPWSKPGDARWQVPDDVTADQLARRLDDVGDRTTAILRDHPLDTRAAVGGRLKEDPPTLEWICFHVLAEYARHAGHLDIVVEQAGSPTT